MNAPKWSFTAVIFILLLRSLKIILIVLRGILILIQLVVVWIIVYSWNKLDKKGLLVVIQTSFHSPNAYLYLSGILLLSGVVFFFFKKKQQFWYGILETVVAVSGCVITAQSIRSSVYQTNSASAILIQGFAAVYLLVRGLSNVDDGVKKPFWLRKDYKQFMFAYNYYAEAEKFYLQALHDGELFDEDGNIIRKYKPENRDSQDT